MKKLLLVAIVISSLTCDHGLEPPPNVTPGFGGTIYFGKGTWPAADSLVNLWLFASQLYPLDSLKVFTGLFSDPPTIYLYPATDKNLPLFVDSVSYVFNLPPGTYKYVGVLQHVANDINASSLRVVGVYGTSDVPPLPIPIIVNENNFQAGVNVRVNFRKPPPQPF
ncbi:MAG: hypothetical protein NTU47_18725 [Ignavibacteriales bacterium]|nr:hypothetical protein [Ignavibacteriales bacterium]